MRKLFMLVVLGLFVFAACGKKEASATSGGKKTLSFMIWDKNQEPGMSAIARAFEEKNPGVEIKVQVTGWDEYWTKLEAAATGGSLPDIFWMHSTRFYDYANNNILLEVGDTIGDGYKNFPEDLVKLYEFNGKNYAVPKDFDTIGMFYNKALFDKAGVPYPDGTWNWEQFLDTAKKLTKDGVYGIAAPMDAQQGYWNSIYQNGGNVIDGKKSGYDLKASQEGLQWWLDLSMKEKVSPTQAQFSETDAYAMFMSGKVAMVSLGSWMVPGIEQNKEFAKNVGVTYLPKGKVNASIYNGLGYSAAASTKYPEEVKAFLKFTATEEANLLQAKYASAIPAYNGTQQGWVDHNKDMDLKIFVDQLKYGVIFPNSKTAPQWRAYENEIFAPLFAGQVDVKTATGNYAKKMNEILATE
ncbi:MAG: sugar ABC transporter substrate-binding protein [Fusobacteriaceae bacterium]|nr:sugar ABC transporter substrate-binding protein [Fusobacteriaceae bacterium]